jgi:Secretion system C-terminal sorting domain
MKNPIKLKLLIIVPVLSFLFVVNASSATVLTSGSFQSGGGQSPSGGNITITVSGLGAVALGATNVSGGNIAVSGGVISAVVPSIFVPSSIYAYPVPYKPSLGHTRIRFDALSSAAKIKIYDLSGECVKTINKSDSNTYIEWNVKGDNGRNLDSGVYFYTVVSGSDHKTGKIMIIR